MPFVPVIGYVPGTIINPQLGYELWVTHAERSVPYILEIDRIEYQKIPTDSLGGHCCKVCDSYLNIPPLALYLTIEQAGLALLVFIPIRTKKQLHAAR